MPSITLTTVAKAAAQYLGVLDSGESLSADQLADALAACNAMLDNWSDEQSMIIGILLQNFTLTASVQKYTIGTGQTWNVARPMAILGGEVIITANSAQLAFPVEAVSLPKWQSLPDRNATSSLVRYLFYDRLSPIGNVYLSPIPLGGSIELSMYSALTAFADATTAIVVPNGYTRALETALAIELAPQYDVTPSGPLIAMYQDALARVRQLNAQLLGHEPPASPVVANAQGTTIRPEMGP